MTLVSNLNVYRQGPRVWVYCKLHTPAQSLGLVSMSAITEHPTLLVQCLLTAFTVIHQANTTLKKENIIRSLWDKQWIDETPPSLIIYRGANIGQCKSIDVESRCPKHPSWSTILHVRRYYNVNGMNKS